LDVKEGAGRLLGWGKANKKFTVFLEAVWDLLDKFCGLSIAAGAAWDCHPARILTGVLYRFRHGGHRYDRDDLHCMAITMKDVLDTMNWFPRRSISLQGSGRAPALVMFDAALDEGSLAAKPVIGGIIWVDGRCLGFSRVLSEEELASCPTTKASWACPARFRIDHLEALACLVTLETFAPVLVNRRLLAYGDNINQVRSVCKGFTRAAGLMIMAEEVLLRCVQLNCAMSLHWIPSKVNIADHLTRGNDFMVASHSQGRVRCRLNFEALPMNLYLVRPRLFNGVFSGFQGALGVVHRIHVLYKRKSDVREGRGKVLAIDLRDSSLGLGAEVSVDDVGHWSLCLAWPKALSIISLYATEVRDVGGMVVYGTLLSLVQRAIAAGR
jgi:hypothetical protein